MASSGQKLKKALKSAAKLPAIAVKSGGNLGKLGSRVRGRRHPLAPVPDETPIVILRLQVLSCTGLLPKDRNGLSDPFVVVSLLQSKNTTPTCKRTLNPVFSPREATFDFPLYLSVVERRGGVGVLELVAWDQNILLKKEYLGEVALGVDGWFPSPGGDDKERGKALAWDSPRNMPFSLPLESTRTNTAAAGSVQIKLGFVSPPNTANLMDFPEVFRELKKRESDANGTRAASWFSAPPTQGVGTIRSHVGEEGPLVDYEDDGGLSSAEEYYEECEESDAVTEGSEAEGELDEGEEGPLASSSTTVAAEKKRTGLPKLTIFPATPTFSQKFTPSTAVPPKARASSSASPQESDKVLGGSGGGGSSSGGPSKKTKSTTTTPVSTSTSSSSSPAPPLVTSKSATGFIIPKMKFSRKKQTVTSSEKSSPSLSPASTFLWGIEDAGAGASGPAPAAQGDEKKKKLGFRKRWSTGSPTTPPLPPPPPPTAIPSETGEASTTATAIGSASASGSESGAPPPAAVAIASAPPSKKGKKDYRFEAGNDIVGIVMLEIIRAEDLPRLRNVTRTGFDMDPFVVISFGKKVFRTRVIRHSLNPVWDEKLLFHVRCHEAAYKVKLTILDWDKLSSNDLIGDTGFEVNTLVETAPQPNPTTGLYAPDYGGDHPMKEMKLDLTLEKDIAWEAQGAKPCITIRAKYQSYAALRQRFWRQYLTQYDADDTGTISHLELTSMLDSLGSTLTRSTIGSFFERYGKKVETDDLTMDEAIQCLEWELGKPDSERRRVDVNGEDRASSSATPILTVMDKMGKEMDLNFEGLDFSGRPAHADLEQHQLLGMGYLHHGSDEDRVVAPQYTTEPNQMPLSKCEALPESSEEESGASSGTGRSNPDKPRATTDPETVKKKSRFRRMRRKKKAATTAGTPTMTSDLNTAQFERVINVKNCPLCHRPRLNSKAEMDIVTHLAVCASQDWNQVDRIVVGNFVTASQAQRKWYTNVWEKISAGDYRLGANSANIIVQNRVTGQLEEEKMQVYVRLGIRLLYKGANGRMESARARRLLRSLTIKQGTKYDSTESAKEIPAFIQFHQLKVDELLDPLDSFQTFNQFFYRKLKPDARPVEYPDDPYRLVSAADCRFMGFETVSEATKFWIKGRDFSVGRLLGDAYKNQADKYIGGALGIFRLAPQDYHRFHSPVDGKIGPMTYIPGEYYTVNPQAIRTALDVYGENARKIVPIDSPQFGRVMAVCVGAMMVGTIKTTVEEGQQIRRGQEFGYFAFGGSTIVLLFEKGVLEWDEDLLINARASLETLVRVGMGIGKGRRPVVFS